MTNVTLVDLPIPVSADDATFIADCLTDLFAPLAGRVAELRAYLDANIAPPHTSMLLIDVDGVHAGLATVVRFAMPRHLGHGYEVQELVVVPAFRNKGVARRALELVAERLRADTSARKVVIRTNVDAAKRAYGSVWKPIDLTSYQTMLNLLQPLALE